jgi:4-hydroxy-3-polyprenylbenzoate decarboxylase
MAFEHLGEFLNLLADRGELKRVSAAVDARLELAAIVERVSKDQSGPALLFDNVKTASGAAQSIPVAANIFGSESRLLTALGADSLEEIADRITALTQPELPGGWLEAIQLVPKIVEVSQWPVTRTESAMSQQVVLMGSDVDLNTLPIPVCWPGEELPSLTSAQVYIEKPFDAATAEQETDSSSPLAPHPSPLRQRSATRVPIQIRDQNTVAIHWTPHDEAWHLLDEFRRRGQQMPVAIALGGDPVLTYAASAPLPPHVDPLVFAGFLRRESVSVCRARSVEIDVPADAEIILEGLIDPSREIEEASPTGIPTGSYSERRKVPVATITAVTHRANPILPVIVPSRPPSEDHWLSRATERIFLPLVRLVLPEIVDIALPRSGAGRNIAFVSMKKRYPQQARKVMNGLWGLARLSTVKLLVVVDSEFDVHDDEAVWFAVGANAHPGRDTIFSEGPADWHDHATPIPGVGHRMGIDATEKLADEGHPRNWPEALRVDEATMKKIDERWSEFGI